MSNGAARELLLRFGSFSLAVLSGDERLLGRLRKYFRDFSAEPRQSTERHAVLRALVGLPPAIDGPLQAWGDRGKESFSDSSGSRVIRKDRTGVVIETDGQGWSITGDLHRNFSQVVNLIGIIYGCALLDRGGAMLHASAVVQNGTALAMIGESGSGKSSLAVRLLERGCDFLSNDRLIVQRGQRGIVARGLPKLPRVNPGTLLGGRRTSALIGDDARRRYRKLGAKQLWELEEKYDLDVGQTLGRRWLLRAPLGCAFVLDWRREGGEMELSHLTPGQAIEALRRAAKTFGAFDLRLADRPEKAFRDLAHAVPVVRVTGGIDPTGLATRIADAGWETVIAGPGRANAGRPKRRSRSSSASDARR
jgi:HprK-related kinase B